MPDEMVIFSGTCNPQLGSKIASICGGDLGQLLVRTFADGEIFVEVQENVRGREVYVIQSTSAPGNDRLMELLIIIDALKRASAATITAVIPYYGYSRQDRKVHPRTPITAKLVADLLDTAGADRVLTIDLHAGQIQGFFNMPVDNLYALPVLLPELQKICKGRDNVTIVSPDAGGVERARAYAKRVNADLAIIDKRRTGPNQAEVMHIIGEVKGRVAVIVDDMVDTAGTLTEAAKTLAKHGAAEIHAMATHPVLSGPAVDRIENSALDSFVTTDTIPLTEKGKACKKIVVATVGNLLGEAISRINNNESVSSLFV